MCVRRGKKECGHKEKRGDLERDSQQKDKRGGGGMPPFMGMEFPMGKLSEGVYQCLCDLVVCASVSVSLCLLSVSLSDHMHVRHFWSVSLLH